MCESVPAFLHRAFSFLVVSRTPLSSYNYKALLLIMAPALTANVSHQTPISKAPASKSIFPDGIKTSGQHPPLYGELRDFDAFPTEISGPTVWDADDYKNNPERWTHHLSKEETEELGRAADDFKIAGIPLTGISKVFPLIK